MTNTNRVEDLRTELKRLHDELLEDYDEMNSRVLNKVEEARQLLSEEDEIGQWETELLDYAKAAVKVNFLRVAAVSVIMAIEVSQLPPDEVAYRVVPGITSDATDRQYRGAKRHV